MIILTTLISGIVAMYYPQQNNNMWIRIITFLIMLLPVSEFVIQLLQYILGKIVKPNLIPKLDLDNRNTRR